MKALSPACLCAVLALGAPTVIAQDILRSAETVAATRYEFSPDDQKLLDEVQFGCFEYFSKEVGRPALLAKDRMKAEVASIAAVGFQLAALPIGVERKWITRDEGAKRARTILHSLIVRDDNKKFGMYVHFPDHHSAGQPTVDWDVEASTVDTALLLAGAMVAATYFGGEVDSLTDRMLHDANWLAFKQADTGFMSMSWRAEKKKDFAGPGKFGKARWHIASDEEHLIYFVATGSPNPAHAWPPETYYRLERQVKRHAEMPPFVVSWPGNTFTYTFAHCFIEYRGLDADDPSALGGAGPRVDWFENSRRAMLTHRQRCIELGATLKTLSAARWGLSACAAKEGYIVPELRPNGSNNDQVYNGTVAPYAAASAIMFTPAESMAAIRAYRGLKAADGSPLVWRDPKDGGYGFVDSFNLDQNYAHDDYVGIDAGPMILAIENVRTGLIWKLFMQHEVAKRAVEKLRFKPLAARP